MGAADRLCFILLLIVRTTSRIYNESYPGCGGNFTQRSGIITSPGFPSNYPDNIRCQWRISAQPQEVVELRFDYFRQESSDTCNFEPLDIYYGFDSNKKLFGTYCGSEYLDVVMSRNLLLEIRTDYKGFLKTSPFKGFKATFVSKVCGGNFTQREGIITSPGYPKGYLSGLSCQWNITAQENELIELRLEYFKPNRRIGSCEYESLSIYDGFDSNKRLIGEYCGSVVLDVVMSRNLLLEFRTDFNTFNEGFNATFVSKVCGGTFTQREGIITSPGYPKEYPSGVLSCQWNITAQKNELIELRFSDFSLRNCSLCTCDSVTVYAAHGSNIAPIGMYCGNNGPSSLISETGFMQILLLTDGVPSNNGFKASFVRACDKDKYGPECLQQCNQHCSSTTPTTSRCHHVDGRCLGGCLDGYQGLTCQTICDEDRYGPGCVAACSNNCQRSTETNSSCHHVTGHCFSACFDGFHGEKCDQVWSQTIKITAVAVLCALLVAVLIISHVLVYIRRRSKENAHQDAYVNVAFTN